MDLNIHSPLPQKKDWRIGIIGSGFIVNDCHLVAYRKAGFNPVAIASRTRENAAKVAQRHGISTVYNAAEKLLDDPSIEVLDIAVPPNAQFAIIKAACARKTVKGILAQKPLGMDYREALAAVELCEAAGITLAVNQNMRYDQSVRAAQTLLTNGTIGDPVFATIDMRGIPHWMPWQKDLGWVTLRIMSIHHLDCFRYWFGDPERIYCSVRKDPRTEFPHEDGIASYILEYRNGLRCVGIDDTWTGPAKEGCPSDIRINWRIEGLNGLAMGDIGWCKDPYTSPSAIRYASKGMQGFQSPVWSESWFPDAFIGPMAQLLIALEQSARPAIDGRDNLLTMALVDAAYKSVKDKAAVEVQEIYGEVIRERQEAEFAKSPPGILQRFLDSVTPSLLAEAIKTENFTPRAQQVLKLARREAESCGHAQIDDSHLLLGLLALGQGVAVNVLNELSVDFSDLRARLAANLEVNRDSKISYAPVIKKIFELAAIEAGKLQHTYVGTEHILLGILRADGQAPKWLRESGVDIEEVRSAILQELDPQFHVQSNPDSGKTGLLSRVMDSFVPSTPKGVQGAIELNESFTLRAKKVLDLANEEAVRQGHELLEDVHLLLGLLALGQGVGFIVLGNLKVDIADVKSKALIELDGLPGGKSGDEKRPYGASVQKVLTVAIRERKSLHHVYLGTEHILLGILQSESSAAEVFRSANLDIDDVRKAILQELDPNFNA